MLTEVIDELNKRMEEAADNEETLVHDTLDSFYQWLIEKYVY